MDAEAAKAPFAIAEVNNGQEEGGRRPQSAQACPRRSSLGGTTFVVPWKSFAEELELALSRKALVLMLWGMALTFLLVFAAMPAEMACMADTPKWKFAFMLNLIVVFCVLVVDDKNPVFASLAVSAAAVLCGCLDPAELWSGAASDAVTSLAILFPIAQAVADTGLPTTIMGSLLGNPANVNMGVAKMFVALAPMFLAFNGMVLLAMMIPVLRAWSERLGFDKRLIMMPLSYCIMQGGNLSLMGAPMNLVGAAIFAEASGRTFQLGYFSLTLGGIVTYIVTAVYCSLFAPRMLRKPVAPDGTVKGAQETGAPQGPARGLYAVPLVVTPGPLVGVTPETTGIHRIKGVNIYAHAVMDRNGFEIGEGWDEIRSQTFQAGDILQVAATAQAIAAVRLVKGLELGNATTELSALGAGRRRRVLIEASAANSFVGKAIDILVMKHTYRAAVVAVSSPSDQHLCQMSYHGYTVQPGDVLLCEAFKEDLGSEAWLELFSVVRIVPKSSPPATGRSADRIRSVLTILGLLVMVGLSMLGSRRMSLPVTSMLLLGFLFAIRALRPEDAYAAVNVPVLVTIIGALALGKALQQVRVADCVATGILGIAEPYGKRAILAGLYIGARGLGMFVGAGAVVAIMSTIGCSTAMDPSSNLSVGEVCLTVIYAASGAFQTPYGSATNAMVQSAGEYTLGDFMRFGLPLQVVHFLVTVLVAPMCAELIF